MSASGTISLETISPSTSCGTFVTSTSSGTFVTSEYADTQEDKHADSSFVQNTGEYDITVNVMSLSHLCVIGP